MFFFACFTSGNQRLKVLMLDDIGKLLIKAGDEHSNDGGLGVLFGKAGELPGFGFEKSK